jgi:hypothetical protein
MLHHIQKARVGAKEVVAYVSAGFDNVLLVLSINDLFHPLDENIVMILCKERVPIAPPYNLYDIPSCAAKDGFEFLYDLAISAHRPVQSLEVAINHEN